MNVLKRTRLVGQFPGSVWGPAWAPETAR